MSKHVIVLGAGITGLSAAWRLTDNGIDVDILEAESVVGGLAGTVRKNGCSLDFGPHSFFSEDQQIIDAVLGLFDNKLKPQTRKVKFYYQGSYMDYPLTHKSILLQMNPYFGMRVVLNFLKSKIFSHKQVRTKSEEETVEQWAIANFGEYFYRAFFKPYTEQFWKISCSELSSRSIPTHTKMSFMNTLKLLLHCKATKKGDSLIERESLPTYYPDSGFYEISGKIAKVVEKNNGRIHLGARACAIIKLPNSKTKVVYQQNGETKEIQADFVISTIPLPILGKMLQPYPPSEIITAADELRYQSLIVLGMQTKKCNVIDCGYIYILNKPFNRLSNMNSFSVLTSPPGDNVIFVEITCLRGSKMWNTGKEEIFDMCIDSLSREGFLNPGDVKELFLAKAAHAYPIYRKGYSNHLNVLLKYIKNYGVVDTIGRCGEFMYMDIDKCIRRAFDFADSYIEQDALVSGNVKA